MFSTEEYILYGIISSMWLQMLWEVYLSMRQLKVYKNVTPEELQGIYTEEECAKARAYRVDLSEFNIIKQVLSTIIIAEILLCQGFAYFWKVSAAIVEPRYEVLHSAAFMFVVYILGELMGLPFYVYHTFVLEEQHGFNRKTVGGFIAEEVVMLIVVLVIFFPVAALVVAIAKIGGDFVGVYLWLGYTIIIIVLLLITPFYIVPLFVGYEALPDGDLKRQIDELTDSVGFPTDKIYLVKTSEKTTHSNAGLYSFFNVELIVLADSLLTEEESEGKRRYNNDEILAILAHELGHRKHNHLSNMGALEILQELPQYLLYGLLQKYDPIYHAFGFHQEKPILIGLIIASFITAPFYAITSFIINVYNRRCEFQADEFAKTIGKAEFLKSALIKIHLDNLVLPKYDWLFATWYFSHPPMLERLEALNDKED